MPPSSHCQFQQVVVRKSAPRHLADMFSYVPRIPSAPYGVPRSPRLAPQGDYANSRQGCWQALKNQGGDSVTFLHPKVHPKVPLKAFLKRTPV